jgi:hypothetical protein
MSEQGTPASKMCKNAGEASLAQEKAASRRTPRKANSPASFRKGRDGAPRGVIVMLGCGDSLLKYAPPEGLAHP